MMVLLIEIMAFFALDVVIALPSYFGLGSSKVITSLNQVQCSGSEMSLKECSRVESSKSITCLRPGAGVVCPITQGKLTNCGMIVALTFILPRINTDDL